MKQYPLAIRTLVIILLVISTVFCVIIAKDILQPLVLAMLLAFLLLPISGKLESWKVPRIVANLLVILLALSVVAGIIIGLTQLFSTFFNDLPRIKEQTLANIASFNNLLYDQFGISAAKQNEEIRSFTRRFLTENLSGSGLFSATTSTMVKLGVLPVYTFLFLFYRDKFRLFLLDVGSRNRER